MPRTTLRRRKAAAPAIATLAFGGLVLAFAAQASAQTGTLFDEFGANPRASAMGSAFAGIANDASASYYNPAGLGFAEAESYIGYGYYSAHLELNYVDPAEQDLSFSPPATNWVVVGSTGCLVTDTLRDAFPWMNDLRWGGTASIGLPMINSFQAYADETTPYFFRYDTSPSALSIAIAFAWRTADWLSVGGGLLASINAVSSNETWVRLNPPPDDPVHGLDVALDAETDIKMSPTAGVVLHVPVPGLSDPLSIGLSYRGEIANVFGAGPNRTLLGYTDDDGNFVPVLGVPETILGNFVAFAPAQVSFGLGVRPVEQLLVGSDVIWKDYSRFVTFVRVPPDPPFQDTVGFRFGAEYTVPFGLQGEILALKALDIRLGYGFEPTPNPSLNGSYNLLDSNQHIVSGGLGVQTRFMDAAMLRFDLVFQYHLLETRRTENLGDPNRGAYEISGDVLHAGLDIRLDW